MSRFISPAEHADSYPLGVVEKDLVLFVFLTQACLSLAGASSIQKKKNLHMTRLHATPPILKYFATYLLARV